MQDLNQIFGAVESSCTPWYAVFYLLRILRLLIFTKKSWLVITKSQSFSLKIVLISFQRSCIPSLTRGMGSVRFVIILGSNSKKIGVPTASFLVKSLCQWTTKCTRWCLMSSTMTQTIPWSVLKLIDTTRSPPLTISLRRKRWDRIKISSTGTVGVLLIWSVVWIGDKSQHGCSNKISLNSNLVKTRIALQIRHSKLAIKEDRVQQLEQQVVVIGR